MVQQKSNQMGSLFTAQNKSDEILKKTESDNVYETDFGELLSLFNEIWEKSPQGIYDAFAKEHGEEAAMLFMEPPTYPAFRYDTLGIKSRYYRNSSNNGIINEYQP
jgi:hypothetical protein